jgi:hypothetical protein
VFVQELAMTPDLALFLIIVGSFFAVGIPLILRNVRVPVELELEEIAEHELERRQTEFFTRWDDRLAAIGYRPALNYRVTNLQGANLVRSYISVSYTHLTLPTTPYV